ncbi:MAG: VOC family protein [Nitrososphaerota archaeon]|nr:VOC family protein [Aigarchaeota archaeon]MDW8076565.1 VOC family protein [Nitrososphaerota archaeon]
MVRLHHISILVKDADRAKETFLGLLNGSLIGEHVIDEGRLKLVWIKFDDVIVELLQPLSTDSDIYRSLEEKGEGLHHIGVEVDNIKEEVDRLRKLGMSFVGEEPVSDVLGMFIAFVNPKHLHGVLYELVQLKRK